MHQRLAEIVAFLDAARAGLLDAFAAIPEARRDERPRDGAWTPGEVLDHLAVVEDGVARLVAKRATRGLESGLGPDRESGSLLGALDRYQVDSPIQPIEAPEMVRPRPGVRAADAIAALGRSREALRAAIARADGLDLGALKATHAVLGELDLYQWLLFVGKHEQRHAAQLAAARAAFAAGPGIQGGDSRSAS